MNVSYIAHVHGKVQGVYFRASSQQIAIDNGLSGYVKNLDDGDVEVMICGEQDNVNTMLEWLSHGPPTAEVERLDKEEVKWQTYPFFSIN
jgi:acylphosphatase